MEGEPIEKMKVRKKVKMNEKKERRVVPLSPFFEAQRKHIKHCRS
jgi:hypothetical protein